MSIAEADLEENGSAPGGANGKKAAGGGDNGHAYPNTEARAAQAAEATNNQSASGEDCLAQAQVHMPWLDFNARLQLKGSKKKDVPQQKETAGFKLPGFSIRKKQKTESDTKQNSKSSGPPADEWSGEDLSVPKKKRLWSGWDGLTISLAGIALPALILFLSLVSIPKRVTLVLLNHPLETIVELVLMIGVPLINFLVWSAICKNKYRFSLLRGLAMGSAIGTSFITAGVCITALFVGQPLQTELGSEFTTGFIWIALFSLLTGAASIYLANRTRLSHDFEKSRLRVLSVTIAGALLSLAAFAAAEARPWYIRIAEEKALSNLATEREEGWNLLRTLNPEKELLMECSDARAAGLCGLFLPIKTSTQHQLYFALTGKPYSFKDIANTDLSSMPDDYLSRHVVGDKVPGLSMTRSSMTGLLHANTLSSTLDWTFVFKNQGQTPQEARAELGLPPGAVITGLTLWNKGEPQEAAFAASGKAEKYVSANITAGHESPAIITDLGHGRTLLHCFPVKDAEELKVRVTMVMPLKPDGSRGSTLALPRLIAENFELSDEHQIRLRASQALSSSAKSLLKGTNPDGTQAIYGALSKDQVESANVVISVARDEFAKPVAVLDKLAIEFQKIEDHRLAELKQRMNHQRPTRLDTEVLSVSIDGSRSIQKQFEELTQALEKRSAGASHHEKKKTQIKAVTPKYVVETVSKIAAPAPKNLMIVVDGSATLKEFRPELLNALGKIPENVPTRVLIASEEDKAPTAMSLKDGLQKLSKEEFVGGHDNLKSVVKASELAGETERGAVLWIHGPQPVLNQEIYIMAPFLAAPSFYELPLGAGDTDTYDFFKNHSEIGPFSQVPRTSRSVSEDLLGFFSKWRANQNGYEVSLAQQSEKPEQFASASPDAERELLVLHASQQVKELILARHIRKAARVAVAYGMVTPVSCALVTQNSNSDTDIDDLAQANRTDDGTGGASPVLFANALVGGVPSASGAAVQGSFAPSLQGATNGTIGPQGADATYVTGVNTAGTVRVNNLANLEALLNIIANLSEIGLALAGLIIVMHSFANKTMIVEVLGQEIELGQGERIAIGIGLIAFGLCFPGIINWFVASARDANLFS